MRRRLDLAMSLVSTPEVIFLDEPTTGPGPAQPPRRLGGRARRSPTTARRSCSRPSTSRRPTASRTGSRWSTTAAIARPGHRRRAQGARGGGDARAVLRRRADARDGRARLLDGHVTDEPQPARPRRRRRRRAPRARRARRRPDAAPRTAPAHPRRRLPGPDMTDSLTFIGRSLRHSVRSIDALLTAIMLPVSIMLMFVYVFGGAIETDGRYVDYVVPGIIVLCAGFGSAGTAVAVALDMTTGVDRPLPHAADLEPPRCSPATSTASVARNVVSTAARARRRAARRLPPASRTRCDWLAAAGLLLALMTAISWLAACFGLLASSVEAANAITFVAAFAPYLSQRVRPRRHDARRPAVDRRAPARHADRRHAARADARHAASATRRSSRSRGASAGHRDRPPRRRVSVRAAARRYPARGAQGRPRRHPPARDPQPAARRAGPARQADRAGPARHGQGAALPAARPDGGRRPQPPARALQPPRRVRRDRVRASSPTSERDALRVLGARGSATCSARTCRSTATRCRPPERRRLARASRTRGGTREAEFRAHILERLEQEGPLRARDIEDRAQVGWESRRRLDERAQRRPDARPDVGARARRASAAARAPSASGT